MYTRVKIVGASACVIAVGGVAACGVSLVGAPVEDEDAGVTVDGAADRTVTSSDGSNGADGSDGASACPTNQTSCDGICFDTSSALDHCGSCTKKCDAPQVCASGVCGSTCAAKQVLCNATCCTGFCVNDVCKKPAFWVRGDTGVTTGTTFTWADLSDNGNDVKQTSASLMPTVATTAVNNHTALHFAKNARLVGTAPFEPGTGDVVWFHVSMNLGGYTTYKNQVFGTLLAFDPFSGITAGFDGSNRPYGMYRANVDHFLLSTTIISMNEWAIFDARRVAANGAAELRRNGVIGAIETWPDNVNGGPIVVGAQHSMGTEFFNGYVAEIVLFATSMSDTERQSVAQALGTRYGIAVN